MADEEEDPTVSDHSVPTRSSLHSPGTVAEAGVGVGVGSAFLSDFSRESRGLAAAPSLSLPFAFRGRGAGRGRRPPALAFGPHLPGAPRDAWRIVGGPSECLLALPASQQLSCSQNCPLAVQRGPEVGARVSQLPLPASKSFQFGSRGPWHSVGRRLP